MNKVCSNLVLQVYITLKKRHTKSENKTIESFIIRKILILLATLQEKT